ncbi:chemotaxis-specific methylesterase [Reinekea sp. MED297]|uniref:Chemotaxis-specific methylesterase n=1 Tax=Reinekea blandensis MED297 TaxID=314283 RepID=A4BEI2_9GAMM|nr:chemotaxis-specific methylesterase [Reinekea sp. MED297] [Reinekea blandensis MED297]
MPSLLRYYHEVLQISPVQLFQALLWLLPVKQRAPLLWVAQAVALVLWVLTSIPRHFPH